MASRSQETPCELIEEKDQLEDAIAAINQESLIAMDCEGVNLSRKGSLTVLAIGIPSKTYLFDVMKIGEAVFSKDMKAILESTSILKLIFDCRNDADALWHQFNVKLANVMDIQLMQILYERKHPGEKSAEGLALQARCEHYASKSAMRRVCFEWPRVRSLVNCIEWYLKDRSLLTVKNKVNLSLPGADRQMWGKRPLTEDMQRYASLDVQCLFALYEKFKTGLTSTELETASKGSVRQLDIFRDQVESVKNPYENYALLNMYILTDPPMFVANKLCSACHRDLPNIDFKQGLCKLCQIKKFNCKK